MPEPDPKENSGSDLQEDVEEIYGVEPDDEEDECSQSSDTPS